MTNIDPNNPGWDELSRHFASNRQVTRLIEDLRRVEGQVNASTGAAAEAAAALVMKRLAPVIDKHLRNDERKLIIAADATDKRDRPVIVGRPNYNAIYLTMKESPIGQQRFDEWIAIPVPITKRQAGKKPYVWEKIGADSVDLAPLKLNVEDLNKGLMLLQDKLDHTKKSLHDFVIRKAISPLNEFKKYIQSGEFVEYLLSVIPDASLGGKGLMGKDSFNMLNLIAVWCANDHRTIGGGAIGWESVNNLLKEAKLTNQRLEDLESLLHGLTFG